MTFKFNIKRPLQKCELKLNKIIDEYPHLIKALDRSVKLLIITSFSFIPLQTYIKTIFLFWKVSVLSWLIIASPFIVSTHLSSSLACWAHKFPKHLNSNNPTWRFFVSWKELSTFQLLYVLTAQFTNVLCLFAIIIFKKLLQIFIQCFHTALSYNSICRRQNQSSS